MRVLLVEDDLPLAEGLRHALVRAGHAVDMAADGVLAREALLAHQTYDVVILDLGLPRLDGLSLLREMRTRQMLVPVIIVTARDEPVQRIAGLDAGADDYVVKPFEVDELLARLRAVCRRALGNAGNEVVLAGLRLDQEARRVFLGTEALDISPREYQLLELLVTRAGRVVSKGQMREYLCDWNSELSDSAIDLYMHRLRKRLEGSALQLRTIRGFGYLLQPLAGQSAS